MMHKLNDLVQNGETLSEGLKENATQHRNYKLYTSTEIALAFLLDGYLLLSDGTMWNDYPDSKQMKKKMVYGKCFSWSTRENIAMWMLYGDHLGKNGVALSFSPSVLKSIFSAEEIEIVKVIPGKEVLPINKIRKVTDYEMFFTDLIYIDPILKDEYIITYNEQHEKVKADILNHEDIFYKQYEWKYENECRLIVKPTEIGRKKIRKAKDEVEAEYNKLNSESFGLKKAYVTLRVKVSKYRDLTKERFIRSPVYQGNVLYGIPSSLYGKVNWDLS